MQERVKIDKPDGIKQQKYLATLPLRTSKQSIVEKEVRGSRLISPIIVQICTI